MGMGNKHEASNMCPTWYVMITSDFDTILDYSECSPFVNQVDKHILWVGSALTGKIITFILLSFRARER